MNKADSYIIDVNEMESIVQILAQTQAKPTMSQDKRIDHEEEQKTVELAVFLKIVRLIKLLYGNIHLLKEGHIMESGIICRAIDEDCEDISLISLISKMPYNENDQEKFLSLKKQLIDYFYNPYKSEREVRIIRSDIRKAIDDLQVAALGLDSLQAAKDLYRWYSTFTHSKHETIVNSTYNLNQEKYDMKGKGLLTKMFIDNLSNHIWRVMLSLLEVCEILKDDDLKQRSFNLIQNFAAQNSEFSVSPQD